MPHPIEVTELSPQVAKVCGPDAPPPLKMMAASGQAPLAPPDLVTALYVLAFDADAKLADQARTSLTAMPGELLGSAIDKVQHPVVIDGLAQLLVAHAGALGRILLNGVTGDDTVAWVAAKATQDRVLEMVAANEQRMLRHPTIIEALYLNKNVRMSTVDRAVELAARNGLELKNIAIFGEIKAAIEGELIPEATEEPSPDDLLFRDNLDRDEWMDLTDAMVEDAYDAMDGEEESEAADTVQKLQNSLSRLTPAQKIRMAVLGNATQRSVLIRDSNKLVVMAVIKSPTIKESEVVNYSQHRTLPEEALRFIAGNREWTKQYLVKVNLVKNPRTPIQDSLRFLNHLRDKDVRDLERDKNIPQAVARAAVRLRKQRQK